MKTLFNDTEKGVEEDRRSKGRPFDRLTACVIAIVRKPFLLSRDFPPASVWWVRCETGVVFLGMFCAVFLMDAVMPLRSLWFHQALLTRMGIWPVWPSLLLFPGHNLIPPVLPLRVMGFPSMWSRWSTLLLLLDAFLLVFLIYIYALHRLPACVSLRFIMVSTVCLGLLYALIPVLTSPDVFSYIAYARAGTLYHLNPLTATPLGIRGDAVYRYTGWVDQPSAYGPTWIGITCFFQFLLIGCHLGGSVLTMLILLRLLGLATHLGSVALIWSVSGSLQRKRGFLSERRRVLATLAFAWNPLLLLEACTNAHNDIVMLFLLLLVIWFLVYGQGMPSRLPGVFDRLPLGSTGKHRLLYFAPAVFLALGACLKVNLFILAPGLFFYQWQQAGDLPLRQRLRRISASVTACCGLIVVLYAPFWQGGAVLHVFVVNPATDRTINTLPNTLSHLYNGVVADMGFPSGALIGSPSERLLHTLSMCLFVIVYAALCWRALCTRGALRSVHSLVRWMALAWLCYCSIGSPWYWPWYLTTFLGLYALVEASQLPRSSRRRTLSGQLSLPIRFKSWLTKFATFLLYPGTVRLLTFSMLTLYCFTTFAAQQTFVPGLPGFQWSSFSGAWAWLLPLFYFKRATAGPVSREALKETLEPC